MTNKVQKLIIHFTVALITFTAAITISSLSEFLPWHQSNQPALAVDRVLVKAEPGQPPLLPQEPPREKSELSIVIQDVGGTPDAPSSNVRPIRLAKNRPTIIDLDLGEDIDDQKVTLNFSDNSVNYRILQRYRTSMSVSDEGPHLDLIDWRHFDSQWIPLQSLGSKRFRTLKSSQMESTRFPATTKAEILKEVRRRRLEKDWPNLLELVKSCEGPNKGACFVGISSIYLRIQKQVREGWIDIGLVEFRFPMGC